MSELSKTNFDLLKLVYSHTIETGDPVCRNVDLLKKISSSMSAQELDDRGIELDAQRLILFRHTTMQLLGKGMVYLEQSGVKTIISQGIPQSVLRSFPVTVEEEVSGSSIYEKCKGSFSEIEVWLALKALETNSPPFIKASSPSKNEILPRIVSITAYGLDHQHDEHLFIVDHRLLKTCFKNFGECAASIRFDKNKVFVIMPFTDILKAVYEDGIKKAFEEHNTKWQVIRADEDFSTPESICKICKGMQEAGLIVADLTGKNPNVYFELGLAFGLEKRFILMCQNYDDLLFDMRTFYPIQYSPHELEKLKRAIKHALKPLTKGDQEQTEAILAIIKEIGQITEHRDFKDIDVSQLSERQREGLKNAFILLTTTFKGSVQKLGDANLWHQAGRVAHKLNWDDESETFFRTALKHNPTHSIAWNNLGNLLLAQERYEEAEEAYRTALQHNPAYYPGWLNLGYLLEGQERPQEAEKAYRTALQHNPTDSRVWNNLGVLLQKQGRQEEAEEAYRNALKHDPTDSKTLNNLGILLRQQGRQEEAEDAF